MIFKTKLPMLFLILAALMGLMAACTTAEAPEPTVNPEMPETEQPVTGYPQPVPPTEEEISYPAPGSTGSLADSSWLLISIQKDGQIIAPAATVYATLIFGTDSVGGHAGCNTYGGNYTLSNGQLVMSQLFSTMMFCENNNAMDVETALMQALNAVTGYQIEGDSLTLSIEGGQATFARLLPLSGSPFENTEWELLAFVTNTQADGPVNNTQLTVRFENGQLAGSAGCNNYFGSYSVDGSMITVSPLGSTKMACEESVNAQEMRFMSAMQTARTILLIGERLTIVTDEGMLDFQAK